MFPCMQMSPGSGGFVCCLISHPHLLLALLSLNYGFVPVFLNGVFKGDGGAFYLPYFSLSSVHVIPQGIALH